MQVVFQQTQELYFLRVLNNLDEKIKFMYDLALTNYSTMILAIFLVCLSLQLIFIIYIRPFLITSLQNDISESRGILYLIPTHIIENNKREVDSILGILHA